jgi:hypothetical protein
MKGGTIYEADVIWEVSGDYCTEVYTGFFCLWDRIFRGLL